MSKYALEEQLIMEVESHPILYDKRHNDHKSRPKVDRAWAEIASVMNEDEEFVRKKWKNLKDTFRTKFRDMKLQPSGSKGGKKKEWVFYNKMKFLANFIEITGTESNYVSVGAFAESTESQNVGHEDAYDEVEYLELDEPSQLSGRPEKEFVMSSAKKRKQDQNTRDKISNKMLKVLENHDKENATPTSIEKESSIRLFFSSMATKAEAMDEYSQHLLELACLQAYASIRFTAEVEDS